MSGPENSDTLVFIEAFVRCELPLEQLCEIVQGKLGPAFHHNPNFRWVDLNQLCPEPRVCITRRHVENALEMRRQNHISERQLVDWATMIVINHVFYWEREDMKIVAEWVDRLSLDLVPEG